MPSSHTNKFKPGTLAMYRPRMHFIEPQHDVPAYIEDADNSNEHPNDWRYSITTRKGGAPFYVPELSLRGFTLLEFMFFKHPKDGTLMVGKNPALHFLLFTVFASIIVYGSVRLGGFGWQIPVALEVGTFIMYLVGTWLQYRGAWK